MFIILNHHHFELQTPNLWSMWKGFVEPSMAKVWLTFRSSIYHIQNRSQTKISKSAKCETLKSSIILSKTPPGGSSGEAEATGTAVLKKTQIGRGGTRRIEMAETCWNCMFLENVGKPWKSQFWFKTQWLADLAWKIELNTQFWPWSCSDVLLKGRGYSI